VCIAKRSQDIGLLDTYKTADHETSGHNAITKSLTHRLTTAPQEGGIIGPCQHSSCAGGLALLRELEDVGPFLVVRLHFRHACHGIMELAEQCGLETGGDLQHRQQVHQPQLPQRTARDCSASFGHKPGLSAEQRKESVKTVVGYRSHE